MIIVYDIKHDIYPRVNVDVRSVNVYM